MYPAVTDRVPTRIHPARSAGPAGYVLRCPMGIAGPTPPTIRRALAPPDHPAARAAAAGGTALAPWARPGSGREAADEERKTMWDSILILALWAIHGVGALGVARRANPWAGPSSAGDDQNGWLS